MSRLVWGWFSTRGYDRISQKIREFSNTYVQEGLPNVIEKMKTLYPAIDQWAKPEEWSAVIYEQCKKNQLPLTQENLCLILAIIGAESGFRASPRVVDFWMTPSEKFVGKLGIMKSKTSGAMEITVQDIMDREKIGYNEALEEISIIQAGIGFGIEHLKKLLIFIKIFRMTIFDLSVFLLIIMLDFLLLEILVYKLF